MNSRRTRKPPRPWYLILIGVATVAVIVAGIAELGSASGSSARTSTEIVTAANGVVQTTESGSGEVEPGVDEEVNFGTSGTLKSVNVKVGQYVEKGQLLATLDPSSAKITVEQDEAAVLAAKETLKSARDGDSSSSDSSSTATGADSSSSDESSTDTAATTEQGTADFVSADSGTGTTTSATTTTTTTPSTGTKHTGGKHHKSGSTGTGVSTKKSTSTSGAKNSSSSATDSGTSNSGDSTTSTSTKTTKTKASKATILSDKAALASARATLASAKQSLKDTKLYAPVSGKIASLEDTSAGASVSSGSDSSGSSTSTSDSASSSSSSSTSGSTAAGSSTSSSSSGFAEIVNSHHMTMTVELSEDDISSVHKGQVATVSITALNGVKLAGKVTEIDPLGTESSDVVEYDATITIYQDNPKVLAGMSATAEIVTDQASGVTIPSDAVSGSGSNATVELENNGKTVSTPVVVGLKGTSRDVIISGLKAGQQVKVTITLPSLGTTTSSSSSSTTSSRSGFGSSSSSGGFGGGSFGGAAGGAGGGGFGGGAP